MTTLLTILMIILIIYMTITLLLSIYSIYLNNRSNDLKTVQVGYLVALLEALCHKNGISVSEVKMLAFDKENVED